MLVIAPFLGNNMWHCILFIVLGLFTTIYTTICEIATKSLEIFFRNSIFIYLLASVVFYILDYVSPEYSYPSDDPYGFKIVVALYMSFFIFFVAIASFVRSHVLFLI